MHLPFFTKYQERPLFSYEGTGLNARLERNIYPPERLGEAIRFENGRINFTPISDSDHLCTKFLPLEEGRAISVRFSGGIDANTFFIFQSNSFEFLSARDLRQERYGDVFETRFVWLKPGSSYRLLFGKAPFEAAIRSFVLPGKIEICELY